MANEPQKTSVSPAEPPQATGLSLLPNGQLNLFDPETMRSLWSLASSMAKAHGFVPAFLRDNPHACIGVLSLAHGWGMNPFAVMQSCTEVHGKMLPEGKLVHAAILSSNVLDKPLTFAHYGEWDRIAGKFEIRKSTKKDGATYTVPAWQPDDEIGLGVEVRGRVALDAEDAVLRVDLRKCHPRNSTLWATDPEQQIIYAATRKWARRFVPHLLLGVYTPDEMPAGTIDVTPQASPAERAVDEEMADLRAEINPQPAEPVGKVSEPVKAGSEMAREAVERKRAVDKEDDPAPEAEELPERPTVDQMCDALGTPRAIVLDFFRAMDTDSPWRVTKILDELLPAKRRHIMADAKSWKNSIESWIDQTVGGGAS